ncbi:hypothetical protein EXIGLDRAFT_832739 [Exidia glandulosa HHB12029]|uniref:F-box domain-containing protein n=1 Tax=Exidia glandulosa HHB12029 TaxID=1314781 RepID=A0A165LAN2_EXIGL|nr:hypothetical protein EXIGLDRAFT_832739 [Exidia glandulosa HHB12029]
MSTPNPAAALEDLPIDGTITRLRTEARTHARGASFDQDVAGLRARFDGELARTARVRNVTSSLQSRLPDELWCLAWQDLPLVDRLSLLLVCHAWRNIALGCASVWSLVDVHMDLHNIECDCILCQDSRSDFGKRYFPLEARLPAKSNLHLVPRALELGRRAPIILQIRDTASYSDEEAYRFLGELLRPHSDRLRTMHLVFYDNYVLRQLLEPMEPLRGLRVLSVTCGEARCHYEPHNLAGRSIACPALQQLHLPTCIAWRPGIDAVMTPALRRLSCAVDSLADVLFILETCTNLAHLALHLQFGQDHLYEPASLTPSLAKGRERARNLVEVEIQDVTPYNDDELLAIFGTSEIKWLWLSYRSEHRPPQRVLDQLASHCRGHVTLKLTCPSDRCHAFQLISDLTGPNRTIIQKSDSAMLRQTWELLSMRIPQSIMVEISIWRMLHEQQLPPPIPVLNVTTFTLMLSTTDDLTGLRPIDQLFPRLDTLFFGGHGPSEVFVDADALAAVADSLIPLGSLDFLAASRIIVQGDDTLLRQKAKSVRLSNARL